MAPPGAGHDHVEQTAISRRGCNPFPPSSRLKGMTTFLPSSRTVFAMLAAATTLTLASCGVPVSPAAHGPAGADSDSTGSGSVDTLSGDSDPTASGDVPDRGSDLPGTAQESNSPVIGLAADLDGRSYESTAVTGRELVPGSHLTIDFFTSESGEPMISTRAGCNSMGGEAQWDGDRLSAADMSMTAMACDTPLMDQESWWMDQLTAGVTVRLDGDTLTIGADGTTITFTDAKLVHPDRPLQDTYWRIEGILFGSGDAVGVESLPAGLDAVLIIESERLGVLSLNVYDGLTWLGAPAGQDGDTGQWSGEVRITPDTEREYEKHADPNAAGTVHVSGGLAGDSVGCAEPGCNIDTSVLASDFYYEINGDQLKITGIGDTADRGFMLVADDDPAVTLSER